MANQYNSGISLKNDIASIRTDPTFHDVVLVCADGVEIGACRAILASRSTVFKEMFYGNTKGSISSRATFHDIKSATMHAVLSFIYTEDIDLNAISLAVEVCRAASLFLLPKLMHLVLERTHDISDFGVATSFLNDVAASVPWNDNTKFYDIVFKPFCANPLAIGSLNGLSDKALKLLLTHTKTVDFETSEYDLLLCIIEWAWARDTNSPLTAERRAIFNNIKSLPTELSNKIRLQSEASRTSLLELLDCFDLTLVCPHRLKCLIKSINVFDELPQYMWAFCYHACENTKCGPAHPSRFRGVSKLQWDQPNLASDLVFSEEDTVVEYPMDASPPKQTIVRASTKCSADRDGICKWTIVVESLGSLDSDNVRDASDVGLVEESFDSSKDLYDAGWCFISELTTSDSMIYCKGSAKNCDYGVCIKEGDIVTFHLDLNNRTCALSINGHNYGVAWRDLPNVNLYPAVGMWAGTKYRIKAYE